MKNYEGIFAELLTNFIGELSASVHETPRKIR